MEEGDLVDIIEGEYKGKRGVFEEVVWSGYASVRVPIDGENPAVDIPLEYLKRVKD